MCVCERVRVRVCAQHVSVALLQPKGDADVGPSLGLL